MNTDQYTLYGPIYVLLREEVSVRTAVLQGHAVASGAQAVSRHSQRAVVVCQGSVLYHRHVPQKGVRLSLCLDSSTKVPREKDMITTTYLNVFFISSERKIELVQANTPYFTTTHGAQKTNTTILSKTHLEMILKTPTVTSGE